MKAQDKNTLINIIRDYDTILSNITPLIEVSGFKVRHVAQSMKLDTTTFYYKRVNKKFTPEEVERLLLLLNSPRVVEKAFECLR